MTEAEQDYVIATLASACAGRVDEGALAGHLSPVRYASVLLNGSNLDA